MRQRSFFPKMLPKNSSHTGKNDVGNKLEKNVFGKLHDTQELAALRADGIMYYHVYHADLLMLSKSNELLWDLM